jgi:hypothetical protein
MVWLRTTLKGDLILLPTHSSLICHLIKNGMTPSPMKNGQACHIYVAKTRQLWPCHHLLYVRPKLYAWLSTSYCATEDAKWTRVLNLGLLFVLVRCIASFAILQVQLTFPSARFHYLYVVRTSDGLGFPSNQAIISSLSLA